MMRQKKAFTLIELLVVVAIIAVLIAVLLPALTQARNIARSAACMANVRSIVQAVIVYASANNDVIPVVTESPALGIIRGKRETPLILRDEKILPITNENGGVWRCPLDIRNYKPNFLAFYYYNGGPGDEYEWTGYAGSSYLANQVFRAGSERSPWSAWTSKTTFLPKRTSQAANPSSTIMLVDGSMDWDASADNPYQLFYYWYTMEKEYYSANNFDISGLWRHKPSNFGPFGNAGFLDGHAATGIDYINTCLNSDGSYSSGNAARWWSFTGE